ncbi:gala protein [Nannocystaceae bacterium ST9]
MDEAPELICPAIAVPDIVACDPGELDPLLAWLRADRPVDELTSFPRGTALPDGRLDLCKQSLGLANAELLFGALRGNRQVRSLLLGTDGLRSAGAIAVANMLATERPPGLETLYLGCNHIEPEGVAALADAITEVPVRALWLKRNPVGVEGARVLATLLREQPALEVLDLTNTKLTDAGAEAIAGGLRGQAGLASGLRVLLLGGNGIGVRGAEALADAIAIHPHLRELGLAASQLGDAGVHALARGIGRLESLDLASNGMGVSGLGGLIEAGAALKSLDLGSTPSSRVLGARDNELGDAVGGALLGEWLAGNPGLGRLDLRHAGVRSRGALAILAGLESNDRLFDLQLGKFVARQIKRKLRIRLDANRANAAPERLAVPWHVAAILSVYRSKRPGR